MSHFIRSGIVRTFFIRDLASELNCVLSVRAQCTVLWADTSVQAASRLVVFGVSQRRRTLCRTCMLTGPSAMNYLPEFLNLARREEALKDSRKWDDPRDHFALIVFRYRSEKVWNITIEHDFCVRIFEKTTVVAPSSVYIRPTLVW